MFRPLSSPSESRSNSTAPIHLPFRNLSGEKAWRVGGQGSPSNPGCAYGADTSSPSSLLQTTSLGTRDPGPRQQPRRAHAYSTTPRPLNILFHVLLVVGATGSPPASGNSGRPASARRRGGITGLAGPGRAEEFTRRSRSPPTLTPPI